MALNFAITVHGEFETMRQVLAFISTLVNSSAYKGGITAFFILSLTLTMATGMFDLLFGDHRKLTTWVKLFFIAVFLYAAFLSGSAQVTLYDDVTGNSQTQGNIPPGIAAVMAIPNWVATEFEDLVKSYLAPSLPLSPFAYEYGVKMIGESYTGEMASALANIIDPQMWESAGNYVQDCVALLAARESSYAKKLYSGDNPYQAWGEAINYFFYTYTSLDANGNPLPAGTPDQSVTCTEAWNRLNKYFQNTRWHDVVDEFCTLMHFGTGTTSISACRNIMSDVFSRYVMGGLTVSPENIARNVFAGKVFYAYLSSLDPSVSAARIASFARVQAELTGKGIVAQEWLPVMKTVFYILACAMIPLALLFIGTGTGPVKFLVGLFIWWAIWCGMDALMYCLWISRADGIFQVVRDGARLGLHGLEDLWFLSSKAFAVLGGMRTFGFMLAGAFVYTVFRFGGTVMAHLASGIVGSLSAGASEASGYVSAEDRAWMKTHEALGRYAREARAVHQTGPLAYYERRASAEATETAARIKGFEGFRSAVGPNTLELLSRARTGGLLQSTARGIAAANVPLSALAGYYGIELGKNVLTAGEIEKQAREAGFSSVGDYLSAVAEGKAGGQVADAVRWEQMRKFFPGTSPTDLAGWLSGKQTPPWGVERKLSEWTGLSTGVFSDLKVKDFAWDAEKGAPSLLTLGGTLDKQALTRMADEFDVKGRHNTARGLREVAEKYGSAAIDLTLDADGNPTHLNVNAGSEVRSYDLYHDKDLTNLERYRRGEMALSAGNEEEREILQDLRKGAMKAGYTNGVKRIDYYLAHPEKAAKFRWTTDKNGNLATLEMKEGSQWKRLDTGSETTGITTKDLDSELYQRPIKLTLSKNPLTGEEKATNVLFQGKREGNKLHADWMAVEVAPGKYMPLPLAGDMYLNTLEDPQKAMTEARKGAPLLISSMNTKFLQDKFELGGGAKADVMSATQALKTARQGIIPGVKENLRAEAEEIMQFLFHSPEQAQYAYAMAAVNDLQNLIKQEHGVDLQGFLKGQASIWAQASSNKQALGWLTEKLSGFSAGAKAGVLLALQKAARDHTEVDMLRAAVWNIWSSDKLTDSEKVKAVNALLSHVKEEALSTVKTGDPAKPAYTRGADRVMDGLATGHDVGSPGMGHTREDVKAIGHAMKKGAKVVKDLTKPASPEEIAENVESIFKMGGIKPGEPQQKD